MVSLRVQIGDLTISSFDDFTPSWFKNIGYSLILAFFFKAILSPVVDLIIVIFFEILRFWDRGFTCDRSKTRKKTQKSYQKLYTNEPFELDFCYADKITTIFIAMTLAPVIPLIFPVCFISLFVQYWKDKFISRLYFYKVLILTQKPLFYDHKLSRVSRKILYFAIPMNLILSIWVFGNYNLLEDPSGKDQDTSSDEGKSYLDFWNIIAKRCTRPNSQPFFVLLVYSVVMIFVVTFVKRVADAIDACVTRIIRCKKRVQPYTDDVEYTERVQTRHIREEKIQFLQQTKGQGYNREKYPLYDFEQMRESKGGVGKPLHSLKSYTGQMNITLRYLRILKYNSKISQLPPSDTHHTSTDVIQSHVPADFNNPTEQVTVVRRKKFQILSSYDYIFNPLYKYILLHTHNI